MEKGETHFWLLSHEVAALSLVACAISIMALSVALCRVIFSEGPSSRNFSLEVKIDLNSASREDLALLPGVGPSRASKIVHYRSLKGGFESVGELTDVPGLPAEVVDKIRDRVKIEQGGYQSSER